MTRRLLSPLVTALAVLLAVALSGCGSFAATPNGAETATQSTSASAPPGAGSSFSPPGQGGLLGLPSGTSSPSSSPPTSPVPGPSSPTSSDAPATGRPGQAA